MKKQKNLGYDNDILIPKMLGVKGMNNHIMNGAQVQKVPNQVYQDVEVLNQTHMGNGRKPVAATNPNPWEVSLDLTRESQNIHSRIPFALFSVINQPTGWFKVFSQLSILPSVGGVIGTVAYAIEALTGDALFTWTVGAKSDIIRIHSSSDLNDYSQQLEMIRSGGSFTSSGFRFEVSATYYTAQLRAYNLMTAVNAFGGVNLEQSSRMKANKGPNQFQNAIIDVPVNLAVDNVYSVVGGFPYIATEADNYVQEYSWDFSDVDFDSNTVFVRTNC